MIVQIREDCLRLFTQHDHGLMTGALAQAWVGNSGGQGLSFDLTLAAALHDAAWRQADESPLLDPQTGRPHDFISYPYDRRLDFYSHGVDALEALSVHAALLTSRHYVMLSGRTAPEEYRTIEAARQTRLRLKLHRNKDEALLHVEQSYLLFLDALSLFVCMTPPGAKKDGLPGWVEPERFARTPDGQQYQLEWRHEGYLVMEPFGFRAPLKLQIPYVELPKLSYDSPDELENDWQRAASGFWTVTIGPGEGAQIPS